MKDENASKNVGILGALEKVATIGTLLKTLAGFIVGFVASSIAVYQYFANTSTQLCRLQHSVINQSTINNDVVRAAKEIRSALVLFKQNLDSARNEKIPAPPLPEELSKTLGNITNALETIEKTRDRIQIDAAKPEAKCS